MKKTLCFFLSLILAFSFAQICVSAQTDETELPFSYSVFPEKQEYAKGEKIGIRVSLKNTSLDMVTDMRIWMDYPLTDYYLTPGATEKFEKEFTDGVDETMRVAEDEGVLAIVSKFENTKLVRGFLLRLAHAYKSLTLIYTTVKYGLQNCFVSVGQKTADLGTAKVVYDNTEIEFLVKCRFSVRESEHNGVIVPDGAEGSPSAEITAVRNSFTGLAFAVNEDKSCLGLFAINPDHGCAYLYRVENGRFDLLGVKTVSIEAGRSYGMKTDFDGGRAVCYLYCNPLDGDPYPVFDTYYSSAATGCGAYAKAGGYSDFATAESGIAAAENSYVNPIYGNAPDPYVLYDDGMYYLYATTDSPSGFRVSSSADLVSWTDLGFCARKGDIFGNDWFWAPEVYKYNGKYYLLHSTDEHLALAVSDSPAGPFVKTKDGYLIEDKCIDGHLLFDDDGTVYLYMAYWGESGEEIWGCRMNSDLSGIDRGTLTRLTSCRKDESRVNEGPYMLKHNGKYYLTYSVNGYTSQNYSVRLAVGDSPLGKYEPKGTILEKSGPIVGTGHHSFAVSPDGTELFIVYHCHYSTEQVHARKLCIDRCKFVETDGGCTISVYGPTSTPQPYPSDNG